MSFTLHVVSPEKKILEAEISKIALPTTSGNITVYPNHIPLITQLSAGEMIATIDGEETPMVVAGGFAQIERHQVTILADYADHIDALDTGALTRAREEAEKMQNDTTLSEEQRAFFVAQLERSLAGQKVIDRWTGKKYRKLPAHLGN